jgi:hypothetical protein
MISRSRASINRMIAAGVIEKPAMTYSMRGEQYKGTGYWRAKDIYNLHDVLLEPAPPGKRSRLTHDVPSRMELVAMMEEGVSYVIEDKDGNRTRAFRETMW